MFVYILCQGQKVVLTFVEFDFVDYLLLQISIVSTFFHLQWILYWKFATLLWPELLISNM